MGAQRFVLQLTPPHVPGGGPTFAAWGSLGLACFSCYIGEAFLCWPHGHPFSALHPTVANWNEPIRHGGEPKAILIVAAWSHCHAVTSWRTEILISHRYFRLMMNLKLKEHLWMQHQRIELRVFIWGRLIAENVCSCCFWSVKRGHASWTPHDAILVLSGLCFYGPGPRCRHEAEVPK